MGFGFDDFPKSKVPGRTNFGGGSIGLSYSDSSKKAILYVNKKKVSQRDMHPDSHIGLGLSKLSMEVFVTCDGELHQTHKIKFLGQFYPVLNIGSKSKVEVIFEK